MFPLFLCIQDLQESHQDGACLYLSSEFEDFRVKSQFNPVCQWRVHRYWQGFSWWFQRGWVFIIFLPRNVNTSKQTACCKGGPLKTVTKAKPLAIRTHSEITEVNNPENPVDSSSSDMSIEWLWCPVVESRLEIPVNGENAAVGQLLWKECKAFSSFLAFRKRPLTICCIYLCCLHAYHTCTNASSWKHYCTVFQSVSKNWQSPMRTGVL